MMKALKVCSLFSGIGGIDFGFQQAGLGIVWTNKFDRDAANIYPYNLSGGHLVKKNIGGIGYCNNHKPR